MPRYTHIAVTLVTPPEPFVSLAEAKLQCRVDHDEEDSLIADKLAAAIEDVEDHTARRFVTQTWDIVYPCWPRERFLLVPFGRLQSVASLAYTTAAGDAVTLTEGTHYLADTASEPGRIVLPRGASWPSGELSEVSPIVARIVCGYGDAADVPKRAKAAVLLQTAHLYKHRESVIVGNAAAVDAKQLADGVQRLLSPLTLWGF